MNTSQYDRVPLCECPQFPLQDPSQENAPISDMSQRVPHKLYGGMLLLWEYVVSDIKVECGKYHGTPNRLKRYFNISALPLNHNFAVIYVSDSDSRRANPRRAVLRCSAIDLHLISWPQREQLAR